MTSFLKRLWHGELSNIMAGATILGVASLASRAVGLVRDRVLAGTFGAGTSLDAYVAAFRLPDTMYNLLVAGALTAGFIPVFATWWEQKGEKDAWKLAGNMFAAVLWLIGIASVVLFVFAPIVVPWTVPGFPEASMELVVKLTRIMLVSPIFLGVSAVMGGVLQSRKRFTAYAVAPMFYNLGIILGAWLLAPRFGIEGVAWGVVFGAMCHALIQWSVARGQGFRPRWLPMFRDVGVRQVFALSGPRILGLAVEQVNLIILLALASALSAGSVAILNFATNIQYVPVSLIGIAFGVAAFPAMATAYGKKDPNEFARVFEQTFRRIGFFVIPSAVLMVLLREPLIHVLLGVGKFGGADIARTSVVLWWFAMSVPAQAWIPLLTRSFYAAHVTWTPLLIAIVDELVNLGFAIMLRPAFGITGLAIAFTISSWVQFLLLALWLRSVSRVSWSSVWRTLGVAIIGSVAMGLWVLWVAGMTAWVPFVSLAVLGSTSLLVYLGVTAVCREPEAVAMFSFWKRFGT